MKSISFLKCNIIYKRKKKINSQNKLHAAFTSTWNLDKQVRKGNIYLEKFEVRLQSKTDAFLSQ
jgi:hypothetical protein